MTSAKKYLKALGKATLESRKWRELVSEVRMAEEVYEELSEGKRDAYKRIGEKIEKIKSELGI